MRVLSTLLFISLSMYIFAQGKFDQEVTESTYSSSDEPLELNIEGLYSPYKNGIITPKSLQTFFDKPRSFGQYKSINQSSLILKDIKENERSVWLEVFPSSKVRKLKSRSAQVYTLLDELKETFSLQDVNQELKILNQHIDNQGNEHFKLKQYHADIEVYGSELLVHTHKDIVDLINGYTYPVGKIKTTAAISAEEAESIANQDAGAQIIPNALLKYVGGKPISSNLVIYPLEEGPASLAFQVNVFPNVSEQWEYIIDANSGKIIHKHLNSCKLHHHRHDYKHMDVAGPQVATESDLAGRNVNIDVFEDAGIYYLLNVKERMFNPGLSNLPNEPVGGILTLNAKNTSPQTDDFSVDHIATNNNVWDAPVAVTAHVNATKSYRYFENTFGRTSYDDKGGTIFSFINVADEDGTGMDNAFWNGFALFYGNGKEAFNSPLAAAEDVAAHELAHGVIQHTANLNYQGESGALNESFADIFGVLIDRDDWTLGETVVNTRVFRSGALRSLSDPHNGGRSLSDPGFQPKTVSEQFRGKEDNGGVHINSGITNYAFYLFASDPSVGRDRAEVVYFKALNDYLAASSNFTALRRAVGQSIIDIFGQNQGILAAYNRAFDTVGIGTSADNQAEEPEITEFEFNPGDDFVIWFQEATDRINLRTINGERDNLISSTGLRNIPSVSDDGSIMLFVGSDNKMYAIIFDWDAGTFEERLISESREWRNVAISKDGTKIAAVSGNLSANEFDNQILIVDLVSETQRWYELSNPTSAAGVSTGDVKFADALEWDHSGEFLMYDAANEIKSLFNDPISYWDIGFLRAWDQSTNSYGDGTIFKLFPSLPENVSVGNPTFTKASPDIIAMDLLDSREGETKYSIIGVNLETSDQGLLFENNTVGYPRYSTRDDLLIFDADQSQGKIIGVIETRADRINSPGEGFVFVPDARWGVWFSNGQRDLSTAVGDLVIDDQFKLYPNPTSDDIQLFISDTKCEPCVLQLFDTQGRQVTQQTYKDGESVSLAGMVSGQYTLLLKSERGIHVQRVVKQ